MNIFRKKINNDKSGIATLEMLIAMAVITLSISAVISLVFSGQSSSVGSQTSQEALYKAQLALENARATARANFNDPSLLAGTTTTTDTSGIVYTKNLIITDIDSFTKKITSQITWGSGLQTSLSTIVSDWQSALGGDTCNPTLSGDWTKPQLLGTVDLGQNNGGTDVYAVSKKAYVTADSSSVNKDDFYVVDVSNPYQSPLPILGSVNTGPGLAAVHVAGKYAYVANISTTSQLQVIGVSTPSSPFVVASLDVTPSGDTAVGNSIFYANKRIYLGLTKSAGAEFYVIDVSSPTSLSAASIKAKYEVNSVVNAITVKNGIAYLAVADDPSTPGVFEQMKILDISQADSGIITPLTPYGSNPSTMSGEGLYISKDGGNLYFGEGGPSNKPEFFAFSVGTGGSIIQTASKYINASVNAITVRNNLAFLWTSDSNMGFQIWDLNSLGSSTPYASLNTQQNATGGFDCDGNLLYTAQASNKALQIIGPGLLNQATLNVTGLPNSATYQQAGIIAGTSGGSGTGTISYSAGSSTACSIDSVSGAISVTSGTGTCSVTATKSGDANYNSTTSTSVSININKASQAILITVTTPSIVVYGSTSTLSSSGGSGTGTVTYNSSGGGCSVSGTTLFVVNASLTCSINATKATDTNYSSTTSAWTLVILQKATPTLSVTNSPITYDGNPHSAMVSGSVPGGSALILTGGSATQTNVGTYAVTANFVPTDINDYNSLITASAGNFVINKATPIISWSNPTAITFGTPLSATQLSATTGVAGVFTYTPPAGTVLPVGINQTLSVHFTPTDTANFNTPVDKTVTIIVNKVTPTISTVIYSGLNPINPPSGPISKNTTVFVRATISSVAGIFPTGTVNFTFFKTKTGCSTGSQPDGTITLNASGFGDSPTYITQSKDTISWQVSYSGNSNYNSVSPGPCQSLTVSP